MNPSHPTPNLCPFNVPSWALDAPALAWEVLRRSPSYRQASMISQPASTQRVSGALVFHGDQCGSPWGLRLSEHPDREATVAAIFWDPAADPGIVATAALPAAKGSLHFDLAEHSGSATVLLHSRGEQLSLFSQGIRMQFDIREGTVLEGPVTLRFLLPDLQTIRPPLLTLRRFESFLSHKRITSDLLPSHRRLPRWHQLILALDAHRFGWSQRTLAISLFGQNHVDAHWQGGTGFLRLRVQRLMRHARRLVAGGYRNVLQRRSL